MRCAIFLKFPFLLCLFITGCASVSRPGPSLVPVTQPAQRIEFPGFTLLPPRGEHWFIATRNPLNTSNITFIKKVKGTVAVTTPLRSFSSLFPRTGSSLQTIAAVVTTFDMKEKSFSNPEVFLKAMQEAFQAETDSSPRHRLIDSDVRLDSSFGEYCVKYEMTIEDRVPQSPDNKFILLMHGHRCLHPSWPRFLVEVVFSRCRETVYLYFNRL